MLTPFATAYVDLQSPAGIGIGALVFNYDGDIYASDESRMLAEMGDTTFRLGTVFESTFADVITSEKLLEPIVESMTEGVPMCSDCAFQPWCGADPVFHHARHGGPVGFKPDSDFCEKHVSAFCISSRCSKRVATQRVPPRSQRVPSCPRPRSMSMTSLVSRGQ